MITKSTKQFTLLTIISLLATLLYLSVPAAAAATTIPGGDVSGTWTAAGSPYLIDGNITVPTGQTLTIEPGVEVVFESWYKLTVNGTLLAEGTEASPIRFFGTHPTAGWLGIRFVNGSDSSRLTYVIVEGGRATGAAPDDKGGGIYIENTSPVISHATIRDNYAKQAGGGIYLTGSNAILSDSIIINNSVSQGGSGSGGGIYMDNSNPVLSRNVVRGNRVYVAGSFSTPTGLGGGIYARRSSPVLRYNVISDNMVEASGNSHARGGGLYFYFGSPDVVDNTISGNWVTETTAYYDREGGGIYVYGSDLNIVNTLLWGDTPQEIFVSSYATLNVAYSDVQGGASGVVIEDNGVANDLGGNINADPLFVDAGNGDYSLQAGSPAIDAGTAYFELAGRVIVDLSSDQYVGTAPDMGAIEFGAGGGTNQPPVAVAAANPLRGSAPLDVQFNADGSSDPDGTIVAYAWDFGDGGASSAANPSYTYTAVGTYQATLTVTDDDGATHSDVITITVVDGTTILGGDVSGTWTAAGSPYRINGNVTVPAGQTLSIEPGVEVVFESWYKLTVNGTLLAEGTEGSPIRFFGTHPTAGWLGIRFVNGSDSSRLTYVIVEGGRATGAAPDDRGGGIYIENTSPMISHATIRNNYATNAGGGIYLTSSNAILSDSLIVDNSVSVGGSASGGGIYMEDSNPVLTRNLISRNRVYVAGSYTTPTGLGGGIYARRSSPVLRYNVISDNMVEASGNSHARGGGLYFYFGSPDVVDNTISGNWVTETTAYYDREGGGIYVYGSDLSIVNTLLWGDTPQEIFVSSYATLNVAYSDVQGGASGVVIEDNGVANDLGGNINADPLFVDAGNGDYSLQAGSPAIDAGTAYFELAGRVIVDLAPGDYNGTAPDQGALESDGTAPQNQPPVAVAAANPESGNAPLDVQFSADGSYDPDGTIVSYAWDLGDGGTSSQVNPLYIYANPGTYDAVLTVSDDRGATASAQVTIIVGQPSVDAVHVQDQVVTRLTNRRWAKARDIVLVADQGGQPVAGAVVTVRYTGPSQGRVSGTTGSDGTVALETNWVRKPKDTWCFEVLDLVKDGYAYDSGANVVTVQCESN